MSNAEKPDIEQERLELDKQRLQLDIAKERTVKLQIVLPILVSTFAIGLSIWTATLQYRTQVSSYNQTRLELFKKLTEHMTDSVEVKKTYAEIFPNDSKLLEREQMATR